ncbi:MAG: hypothetical protein ACOYNB_05830 [Aquabacterium sp.]|uniref:hypothetical protein n=1 Tax=Aquabacterium sp. TaxID=1872578 RepID=UPI003BC46DA2
MKKLSALALAVGVSLPAWSATDPTLAQLRQQIDALRQDYETRIKALEDKLAQAQSQAQTVASAPAPSPEPAPEPTGSRQGNNAFNPAIGLVLSGAYANLSKDPSTWSIPGFAPSGGEVGPGQRGFTLGESELNFSANIDSLAFGALTLAVTGENEVEVEEAYIQSTALPAGLTLKGGRFYAGLGYLNEQHTHTWDFVDAPLTHQAFLGGQFKQEGLQAKWLLPTEQFIELGMEAGQGGNFPGAHAGQNGLGALLVSVHTGGDIGLSNSWRAGASWMQTRAKDRTWDLTDTGEAARTFQGNSRLWVLDGVWKWAPNGNAQSTNFKLQGEYFRRVESGDLTDVADASTGAYQSTQSGWYVQGVYQFMPRWRVGLRTEQLDTGSVSFGALADRLSNLDARPRRNSLMLDWSPSEFHRWRIQVNDDRVRQDGKDTQVFLQYQMNLGAHGAHAF